MNVQMRTPCLCTDLKGCFHLWTKVVKTFSNGRLLIENRHGYVRAVDPEEVAPE